MTTAEQSVKEIAFLAQERVLALGRYRQEAIAKHRRELAKLDAQILAAADEAREAEQVMRDAGEHY